MKIATLTLNPAVDKTMYCGNIKIGETNRAVAPSVITHGGKGTNVSCMLKLLGVESTAYGFVGNDNNGDLFLKLLEPYEINADFTKTKCDTRMNIKIMSENDETMEFNESGGPVEEHEKYGLLEKIKGVINDIDLFIMCGSVPLGIEKSIYRDIINLGNGKTKFIVDCDGEALKLCMNNAKKPYMIKPNQFELEQYINRKFELENNFEVKLGAEFEIIIEDGCP